MWASHQAERPAQLEMHEQVVNRAMALAAELEGAITDREMVAIFELFIRDFKMANTYANISRKEWQQIWVENHLVDFGLNVIVNNCHNSFPILSPIQSPLPGSHWSYLTDPS